MRTSEIEEFIRTRNSAQIHFSTHAEIKCRERGITIEEAENILLKNEILGMLKQNENCYKLWLKYKEDKDLNVIIQKEDEDAHIVTIFPCDIKKRIR